MIKLDKKNLDRIKELINNIEKDSNGLTMGDIAELRVIIETLERAHEISTVDYAYTTLKDEYDPIKTPLKMPKQKSSPNPMLYKDPEWTICSSDITRIKSPIATVDVDELGLGPKGVK